MPSPSAPVAEAVSAALAGAVAGRTSLAPALDAACEHVRNHLDLEGVAIALGDDGPPRPVAVAGGVDAIVGLGPADAVAVPWRPPPTSEAIVTVADVTDPGLPAAVRDALVAHDVQAVHDVALRADGAVPGTLRLLAREPGPLPEATSETACGIATLIGITVFAVGHLERARTLAAQLDGALESRVVIEQAKGMLAAASGDEGDERVEVVFRSLRRYARSQRRGVHDVARDVVTGRLGPDVVLAADPDRSDGGQLIG